MIIIQVAFCVFAGLGLVGVLLYYLDLQKEYKAAKKEPGYLPTRQNTPIQECPTPRQIVENTPRPGLVMETTFYDPKAGVDVTISI